MNTITAGLRRHYLPVDLRDLLYPAPPIDVLQIQYLGLGPVKVIGDEGYLLEQAVERVALYSPGLTSTWNVCSHAGHVTLSVVGPALLICR